VGPRRSRSVVLTDRSAERAERAPSVLIQHLATLTTRLGQSTAKERACDVASASFRVKVDLLIDSLALLFLVYSAVCPSYTRAHVDIQAPCAPRQQLRLGPAPSSACSPRPVDCFTQLECIHLATAPVQRRAEITRSIRV
jgi:hypothetical protein